MCLKAKGERARGHALGLVFFFSGTPWVPGARQQGCPYQVLCDSNVLEPWLDSHPHPATLLPMTSRRATKREAEIQALSSISQK